MSALTEIFSNAEGRAPPQSWPRLLATHEVWELASARLAEGQWTLVALWGEPTAVHMAVYEPATGATGLMTMPAPDGHFPSVGRVHPPAHRLERAIQDLYGLVADGAVDTRPWLDHGKWGVRYPLGAAAPAGAASAYAFLPVEGEHLHQIPVGPVHAGIIEPGHFRFTASGETVVRLEERLGYVHRGVEGLMAGASIERASKLAARASGDTTVAYSIAFAEAVENATGIEAPPRAVWLRALMLELERVANHLGDIGAICNDAAFSLMQAHCAVLRERVLRCASAAFGHRLMMDRVTPGGVASDIDKKERKQIAKLLREVRRRFPALVDLYENTTSLQDRTVGTGKVARDLVTQFGAGGYIGRASGRAFDTRRAFLKPPYDALAFEPPVTEKGDVDARVWVRMREVEQSLAFIDEVIEALPEGPTEIALPQIGGEGASLVEGFRGDIFAWVRLSDDGSVDRCHLRDPSWSQWPLLEAAIEGNIVADFPLCNKSFNCSYAGQDL